MTEEQWNAIRRRDPAYDGVFFYGLKTTKHICRPSCPSRLGKPEHIIIFETVEEGLSRGFTPCLRCRPEAPQWQGSRRELSDRAESYLAQHFREKFSLNKTAEALFVHPSYLHRVFREETGQTMLAYHTALRIREAKELLKDNGLSISYISDALGFSSASHFSHLFHRACGMSPLAYRAQYNASLAAADTAKER